FEDAQGDNAVAGVGFFQGFGSAGRGCGGGDFLFGLRGGDLVIVGGLVEFGVVFAAGAADDGVAEAFTVFEVEDHIFAGGELGHFRREGAEAVGAPAGLADEDVATLVGGAFQGGMDVDDDVGDEAVAIADVAGFHGFHGADDDEVGELDDFGLGHIARDGAGGVGVNDGQRDGHGGGGKRSAAAQAVCGECENRHQSYLEDMAQ